MRKHLSWVLVGGGLVIAAVLLFLFWPGGRSLGRNGTDILILGLDEVEGRSRSDTMILAHIKGQDVVLISIPRDLRLKFPDGQFHKANAAYSLGRIKLARRVVADFLGVPIPLYAVIDYQGFREIVDRFGGVEIDVEKHLKYDDEAQNLHIDIPAGRQLLDGQQALDYIRYRDESGDLGRIKRQQKFIRALLAKGVRGQGLGELNSLARALSRYLVTNLSLVDMFTLAKQLRGLDPDEVTMVQVPGEPQRIEGVDYLEPKIVETKNIVADLVLGLDVLIPSEVRVGVLNGSGALGLARGTAALLRGRGFRVVFAGNADNFNYRHSFLIDLAGDPRKVKLVQATLPGAVEVVTPEEFADLGEGSLDMIAEKGYNLGGVDLLFIGGAGFEIGS
ncbi:MAG: LCP family protein [Candidatus Bipolaricaulia bacterium]